MSTLTLSAGTNLSEYKVYVQKSTEGVKENQGVRIIKGQRLRGLRSNHLSFGAE